MGKKSSGITMEHLIVGGIALLILGSTGVIYIQGLSPEPEGAAAIPEARPVSGTEVIVQQPGTVKAIDDVTFRPRVADVFNPGAPVDVECVIQENGTTIYDSDAIASENATLDPGSTYLLACWNDGQTTDLSGSSITLSSTEYYGYMTYITMPMKSSATFPSNDFTSDFVGMYAEGAPASDYTINPNGEINSTTQADLAANDISTFTTVVQAPDNAAFGDPYASAEDKYLQFACDYNLVGFDDIKGVEARYDGVTYDIVDSADKPDYNTSVFDSVYDIVGLSGIIDNKKLYIDYAVDVSSQAPTDAGCNFTCYLIDTAFYYDSTEGHGFQYDTDDWEDNADIGQANKWLFVDCQ